MQIPTNEELRTICQTIIGENMSVEQWAEIESSDMFQSPSFCGGFDADEGVFLFSWYCNGKDEFWFPMSIELAGEIANGGSPRIVGSPAKSEA